MKKQFIVFLIVCFAMFSFFSLLSTDNASADYLVWTEGAYVNNTEVYWNALDFLNVTLTTNSDGVMFINWSTNASGVWTVVGTNVSVTNGSYRIDSIATYLLPYWTTDQQGFYWCANVTDAVGCGQNITQNFTVKTNTTFVNVTGKKDFHDTLSTTNTVFTVIGVVIIVSVILAIVAMMQRYR